MSAAVNNFKAEQGATFLRTLTFKDGAAVLINLTGWTFRGQVRKSQSSSEILASFTCTILDQVTDTGKIEISLTPAQTTAIPVPAACSTASELRSGLYRYDLEAVQPGGAVTRILQGVFEVVPEITR